MIDVTVYKGIARCVKTHSPTETFLKIGYMTRMSRLWGEKIQSSILLISRGGEGKLSSYWFTVMIVFKGESVVRRVVTQNYLLILPDTEK